MGKRYTYYLRLALLFSDFILVTCAILFTLLLMKYLHPGFRFSQKHLLELLGFIIAWLVASQIMQLYSNESIEKIEKLLRQTIKTAILQAAIYAVCIIFAKDATTLKFLLLCYVLLILFFGVSRFFVTYITESFVKRTFQKKNVAIVGANEMGQKLLDYLSTQRSDYFVKEYFAEPMSDLSVNAKGEIYSPIRECITYASENEIEEVYSTIFPGNAQIIKDLIEAAEQKCIRLRFVPDNIQLINEQYQVDYLGDIPVITLHKEPLEEIKSRVKKRILDIVFSFFVTILLLSWLIPVIGLLIKLETKGPVFYSQTRAGRRNSFFRIIKFRTMKVSESDDEFVQATKEDPRITRVGKFLRKTSLDEMPQFLNVLTGDMSIIGPRPHPIKLNETFVDSIQNYMSRHFIKPGISGWAQVNGFRGETHTPELMKKRIEHDIWYMENWSLMLDIRILFMTIIQIFKRQQAAY